MRRRISLILDQPWERMLDKLEDDARRRLVMDKAR
jgi:hypothetical protein